MIVNRKMSKTEIESRICQLVTQYNRWTYDIPLPDGIWTAGNEGIPHTRLKRVMQVLCDVLDKPLSACRIHDLGCLDGIFSIECGMHGADVTGIEIL